MYPPGLGEDTLFITGNEFEDSIHPTGVAEAVDISGAFPKKDWNKALASPGPVTVADGIVVKRSGGNIYFVELATGDVLETRSVGSVAVSPPVVSGGDIYIAADTMIKVSDGLESDSSGSRGTLGIGGHHDGWAKRASMTVEKLELDIDKTELQRGEETNVSVTVNLDSGLEYTNPAHLSVRSADTTTVAFQEPFVLEGIAAGDATIEATFGGTTVEETVVVTSDRDDAADESTDSTPAGELVSVAVAIGLTAYIASRQGR